jgi:hypothetical protein
MNVSNNICTWQNKNKRPRTVVVKGADNVRTQQEHNMWSATSMSRIIIQKVISSSTVIK